MAKAVAQLIFNRVTVGLAIVSQLAIHASAAQLNGAWANDPSACAKIFLMKDNKLSMSDHSDLFGTGFIIDGDQFTDHFVTCRIKDRKHDASTVRLVTDCSTNLGKFADEIVLRIDDTDRLTRFNAGSREAGLTYFRCPETR